MGPNVTRLKIHGQIDLGSLEELVEAGATNDVFAIGFGPGRRYGSYAGNRIGMVGVGNELALHETKVQPPIGRRVVRGMEEQSTGEQAGVDAVEGVLLPGKQILITPLIFDEVPKSALEGVRRRAPREFLSEVHEFSELVDAEMEAIRLAPWGRDIRCWERLGRGGNANADQGSVQCRVREGPYMGLRMGCESWRGGRGKGRLKRADKLSADPDATHGRLMPAGRASHRRVSPSRGDDGTGPGMGLTLEHKGWRGRRSMGSPKGADELSADPHAAHGRCLPARRASHGRGDDGAGLEGTRLANGLGWRDDWAVGGEGEGGGD